MRAWWVCVLTFAACTGAKPHSEHLGEVAFEMPSSAWERHDEAAVHGRLTTQLTPTENERKESIVVIRSDRREALVGADASHYQDLLVEAQNTLPNVTVRSTRELRTASGLHAVVVDTSFTPHGLNVKYRRVHAILFDGPALVHVMYTAKSPDPDLASFQTVLDSIRYGEG